MVLVNGVLNGNGVVALGSWKLVLFLRRDSGDYSARQAFKIHNLHSPLKIISYHYYTDLVSLSKLLETELFGVACTFVDPYEAV